GYARSTATSPGTTNCAPKRSITAALPCTPTLRTIQGCSIDQHARHIPAQIGRPPTAHAADDPRGDRQEHRDRRARTRSRIMAVVKADGNGHGATTVARAAIAAGAEWLGTTDIAEASRLRAAGLTVPILTWLNPSDVDAEAAATGRIDIAVGSVDELEAVLRH